MNEECSPPNFRVILLGPNGVGKTTFSRRFQASEHRRYIPNHGLELIMLPIETTKGPVTLTIMDPAQSTIGGYALRDGCYVGSSGALIFFDVTNRHSFQQLDESKRNINRLCSEDYPYVLVGNKADYVDRAVSAKIVSGKESRYAEVSAHANYNLELPFVLLLRQIMNDPDLSITSPIPAFPPIASMESVRSQTHSEEEYNRWFSK